MFILSFLQTIEIDAAAFTSSDTGKGEGLRIFTQDGNITVTATVKNEEDKTCAAFHVS